MGVDMLFLPWTTEQKYSAKQAIDSFFVQLGDVGAAAVMFGPPPGDHRLARPARSFPFPTYRMCARNHSTIRRLLSSLLMRRPWSSPA